MNWQAIRNIIIILNLALTKNRFDVKLVVGQPNDQSYYKSYKR